MKPVRILLGVMVMAFVLSLISAGQAKADIEWVFDEGTGTTTVDRSVSANDGTLNGGATWSTDTPFAYSGNHSMSFDGVGGSYVKASSSTGYQFGTGDCSVQAWIKTSTGGENDCILSTRSDGWSRGLTFSLNASGTGFRPRFYFWTSEKSGITDIAMGDWYTDIVDGQWHQLVAVWDSTTYTGKMYVDGVLDRTLNVGSSPGSISPSSEWLTVGQHGSSSSNFDGLIDEVLLVDRQLTANEVSYLYTHSLVPEPTCLVLLTAGSGLLAIWRKRR